MSFEQALWTPPGLCGCQLSITAVWTGDSVKAGLSFRHPVPKTIQAISIVSVCPAHQPQTLSMPDTSGFFETDPITGLPDQRRGYLNYPIASPTPAECLYTFLTSHRGQTHGYPCGCKAYQFFDENGNVSYLPHPRHTKQCNGHKGDTLDMQAATQAFNTLMAPAKGSA